MNCEQLRDQLLDGRFAESPEVQAHVAECSACHELLATQALVDTLRRGVPHEAPGADQVGELGRLQQEVRADLARETGPLARLKSLPTRTRLTLALAVVVAISAVEGTLLARADMPLIPLEHLLPLLGILGVVAVLASWAALRPLFRSALPRWVEVAVLVLCLSVPVGLSFVQPETGHPATLRGSGSDMFGHAGVCLVHGVTLALLVWLAFRALDRQALDRGPRALTAGMAGAVVATLGLQLHCAIPAAPHWLFGHAGVGAAVLAAAWIRRKLSNRS
ncbi:MAG TPA: hypothetical protein VFU02_06035 [Polyangiaceae bacterium]|nr:hypothetical protein [Polyangiaceae bacterium]